MNKKLSICIHKFSKISCIVWHILQCIVWEPGCNNSLALNNHWQEKAKATINGRQRARKLSLFFTCLPSSTPNLKHKIRTNCLPSKAQTLFSLHYHVCICFLFFFKLWNKQVHWWCYRRTLSTVARFSLHTRDRFEKSLFWTTFVYFCSSCVFMTSGAPPRCCISPTLQIQSLFPVLFPIPMMF